MTGISIGLSSNDGRISTCGLWSTGYGTNVPTGDRDTLPALKPPIRAGVQRRDGCLLRVKAWHEISVIVGASPGTLQGVEVNSGAIVASDFSTPLDYSESKVEHETLHPSLTCGGKTPQPRQRAFIPRGPTSTPHPKP